VELFTHLVTLNVDCIVDRSF